MKRSLSQVAKLAGGVLEDSSTADIYIDGVSKDTRTLVGGNLYIPIIGENFDGHDFISQAREKGAAASLWQKDHALPQSDIPLILVDNVLEAFQTMAKNYRRDLGVPVIAITGSNGKTTSKDILLATLSSKYRAHATKGNENNEIGLPLTIVNAAEDTEVMVLELGTESFGEIDLLTRIAQPEVAVITNVGDSHLDQLGSKANVAKEKVTIVNGLKESGVLVYNKDDAYLRAEVKAKGIENKTLSFGMDKDCKYIIDDIQISPNSTRFTVNGNAYEICLPGRHEAYNASISIIIAQLFNIGPRDLEESLKKVSFNAMRNELLTLDGFEVIDDSYKANPQNVIAGIKTMDYYTGYTRKIVVLADMLDLGENIDDLHRETLGQIDPESIDYVLLYGKHMKAGYEEGLKNFHEANIFHFATKEDLVKKLKTLIIDGALVLVKGSRSMAMEDVVQALKEFNR